MTSVWLFFVFMLFNSNLISVLSKNINCRCRNSEECDGRTFCMINLDDKNSFCMERYRINNANVTVVFMKCTQWDSSSISGPVVEAESAEEYFWRKDKDGEIYLQVDVHCRKTCYKEKFEDFSMVVHDFKNISSKLQSKESKTSLKCACDEKEERQNLTNKFFQSIFFCPVDSTKNEYCIYEYHISKEGNEVFPERVSFEQGNTVCHDTNDPSGCLRYTKVIYPVQKLHTTDSTIAQLLNSTVTPIPEIGMMVTTFCRDRDFCNNRGNFELYLARTESKLFKQFFIDIVHAHECVCDDLENCPYIDKILLSRKTHVCFRSLEIVWNENKKSYDHKIVSGVNELRRKVGLPISEEMILWKDKIYLSMECNQGDICNAGLRSQFEKYCINSEQKTVRKLWSHIYIDEQVSCYGKKRRTVYPLCPMCRFFKQFERSNQSCVPNENIVPQSILKYYIIRSNETLKEFEIHCKYKEYCNDYKNSKKPDLTYACPWIYDFKLPPLEEYQQLDDPKGGCPCNEGDCIYKNLNDTHGRCNIFSHQNVNGICYKHLIYMVDFHPNVLVAEGCAYEDYAKFDMRRTISVFKGYHSIIKFESRIETYLKKYEENINCFAKKIKKPGYGSGVIDITDHCPCTLDGMQKEYKNLCINNVCTKAQFNDIKFGAFLCVDWGNKSKGCYLYDDETDAAPLWAQVMLVENIPDTTEDFATIHNYRQAPFPPDISLGFDFGCPLEYEEPAYIAPPRRIMVTSSRANLVPPSKIFGPVAAVVTVFLTLITTLVVTVNLYRIYQVECKWAEIDRNDVAKSTKSTKFALRT